MAVEDWAPKVVLHQKGRGMEASGLRDGEQGLRRKRSSRAGMGGRHLGKLQPQTNIASFLSPDL